MADPNLLLEEDKLIREIAERENSLEIIRLLKRPRLNPPDEEMVEIPEHPLEEGEIVDANDDDQDGDTTFADESEQNANFDYNPQNCDGRHSLILLL